MKTEVEKVWLNHYPEEVPASMAYENRSLHSYLQEVVQMHPEKEALHFMGLNMTYEDVYQSSLRFANQLKKLGIIKGDRVAIMLANTPQSVICYYGALFAGAIVVQTNPLYTEREIEHQLVDSQAKVIICLDQLFPRVEKVRTKTQLEYVIVTGIKDYLPFPKNVLYPFIQKRNSGLKVEIVFDDTTLSFKQLLRQGVAEDIEVPVDPKEDLALLQYTGGTTGLAKGVMLTHYNLVVNTMQCSQWMYKMKKGEERLLAVLPFFHVYGMTVAMNFAIMNRSKMVILPKFEPKQVLKAIEKHQITIYPGAPTMYMGLINEHNFENYELSSIKACISGSAPLPLEVQQQFESKTGGHLVEGYGLTEASPVVISNPIWGYRKRGSIGIPWPDTEVAIMSEEKGLFLQPGEIGEIAVKGPQVMKGYWNRPEETEQTFYNDWLLTGDMGYMDEEGYFYIVDRKKDMIIASGFNIYPREIEEILYEHESVQEAAVIGIPDPYRGETVKAFIVRKVGRQVTEEELETFCRKHLAAYKVPRYYDFRDDLPKTMVGKVLRRKLVEEENEKKEEKSGS